jgi:hypothetical protein
MGLGGALALGVLRLRLRMTALFKKGVGERQEQKQMQ